MSAAAESMPEIQAILEDPAASDWLKVALTEAIERDPVDALNDALLLAQALDDRLRETLGLEPAE
jgi:hypothetical protein